MGCANRPEVSAALPVHPEVVIYGREVLVLHICQIVLPHKAVAPVDTILVRHRLLPIWVAIWEGVGAA